MEWISVKVGKPTTQESVLVFCGKSMRVASFCQKKWYLTGSYHEWDIGEDVGSDWDYESIALSGVTHWMPLPDPPNAK